MIEIMKTYTSRYGDITLERYIEGGKIEYHVRHSNKDIPGNYWTENKSEAVRYYQFLCYKY